MPRPGVITPPRYSPFPDTQSKVVAVPKSTTMQVLMVALVGGDRVHDAVGADLLRVVVEDRHAGLDARPDHQRLGVK
jgi:hypothetical protein